LEGGCTEKGQIRTKRTRYLAVQPTLHCLGAALTRLEVQIVLQHLTTRIPSLRLSPDQRLTYTPNIAFRGPKQLFVEWD